MFTDREPVGTNLTYASIKCFQECLPTDANTPYSGHSKRKYDTDCTEEIQQAFSDLVDSSPSTSH